jgi:hypothetical protein
MLQHFKLIGLAGLAALTLSGCGGHVALKIDHTPPQEPTSALASIAPTAIKVLDFSDQRPGMEPLLLGKRYDSNQAPKGEVTVQRPVSEIVTEAVRAELAAAGHRLVADGEEVVVSGVIKDFSVNTPSVSTLGWDVVAQVGLVVETQVRGVRRHPGHRHLCNQGNRANLHQSRRQADQVDLRARAGRGDEDDSIRRCHRPPPVIAKLTSRSWSACCLTAAARTSDRGRAPGLGDRICP